MTEPDFQDVTTHEQVPLPPTTAPTNLRGAFIFMGVLVLLLLVFEGESIRTSSAQMKHGWQRTIVAAVGEPSGWVARKTGAHEVKQSLVSWARPSSDLPSVKNAGGASAEGELTSLLITGDSMAQPLDSQLAQAFTAGGSSAQVVADVHLGTAISQPELLDWVATASKGAARMSPDAVVVLLGANEGFPLGRLLDDGSVQEIAIPCCGSEWTEEYSKRAGKMMDSWSRDGAAEVYWLTLPTPKDADRKEISDAVNAAVRRAAQERPGSVRVVDINALLTPGNQFRAAMPVDGRTTVVRERDGVHINEQGSELALAALLDALRQDFETGLPAK